MKYAFPIGLAALFLMLGAPAEAHPFHSQSAGFSAGFVHPFSGWDHLLAMSTLGVWLGLNHSRNGFFYALAAWSIALSAGFVLGLFGVHLPLVESGILATVLLLGLLAATAARVPAAVVAPMLAAFAVFHGHAHGTEAPIGASVIYASGFLVASAGIVSASYVVMQRVPVERREAVVRALGIAMVAAGAALGFAS